MAEIIKGITNVFGGLGLGPAAVGSRATRALVTYAPEAVAQLTDNAWNLIQDPLTAKLLESVAGWIGIAVTELVPQIQAIPELYHALQEFFSHWGTKILDPTPDQWIQMGQSLKQMLSPGAFANPGQQIQNLFNGVKANLDKSLATFGLPTTLAWPNWSQLFPAFALPNLGAAAAALPPTISQQALSLAPPQGYQRSAQITMSLPQTFGAPNLLGTVNLAASSMRRL